jgi:predicted nucleic acid-binding protein
MALKFLLDTNVVSELVKPSPHPAVLAQLERHHKTCAIAAGTLEELTFGCWRLAPGRRRELLEEWLVGLAARFPVLPYDDRAAWWLGLQRARLAAAGVAVAMADGQIASLAAVSKLTLVTRNLKDFKHFSGLLVANWHSTPQTEPG